MKWNDSSERISISKVVVGDRRRTQMGEIAKLAASMEEEGQLYPLIVTDSYELIDGGRRLEAAKRLGWNRIEVRPIGSFSWEEIRHLEKDVQNLVKEFTSAEQARQMVKAAEEVSADIAKTPKGKGTKGGRPTKGNAPRAAKAKAVGTSEANLRNAEAQVAAVEKYPVLESWNQKRTFEAEKTLDAIRSEAQRASLVEALEEQDAAEGRKMLGSLEAMTDETRSETLRLLASPSEEKHGIARTRLLQRPPPVPKSLTALAQGISFLRNAQKELDGDAKGLVSDSISSAKQAEKIVESEYKQLKRKEGF